MTKYYSRATGGFYSPDIHAKDSIPGDAFELTDEQWQELLREQATGKRIVAGTHGGPILVEPDPAPGLLIQRDTALRETDWLVARHRDEIEMDPNQTTLTPQQYSDLQQWRRSLRNITFHPDWPRLSLPERPV